MKQFLASDYGYIITALCKKAVINLLCFNEKKFVILALCQILLMLVKKSYICLMKALNRTRLFS
ncbi:hypothetical protein, partial [Lactobacillus delbrueckii]|uniref:hypothetical protein n=1 Tax=Lactobacillus delbrueckii TaxID=1584 RepID=UPI0021A8A816